MKRATKYGREVAFLTALLATVGSLFTSFILGWEPCVLCTLQRVFMYPLVLILGWVLFYDTAVSLYLLLVPLAGVCLSLYHHLLVRFDPTQDCGLALPCVTEYGFYIGPIGIQPMYIPLLALVAFVLITVSLGLYAHRHNA